MTAMNIIPQKDAIHVVSDGALTGNFITPGSWPGIIGQMPKVTLLTHLNAAVIARGTLGLNYALATTFSHDPTSFDDLVRRLPDMTRASIETDFFRSLADQGIPTEFDLCVAGWSETEGPCYYALTNREDQGYPLMVPRRGEGIGIAPGTAELNKRAMSAMPHLRSAADFRPIEDGITLVGMQRETPGWGVGCFVQLTTIKRDRLTTRIIHRWPEDLGRRMERLPEWQDDIPALVAPASAA